MQLQSGYNMITNRLHFGYEPVTTKIQPEFEGKILKCLDKSRKMLYNIIIGALAQLGAHHPGSVGVRGSNPLCSTSFQPREWLNRAILGAFAFEQNRCVHYLSVIREKRAYYKPLLVLSCRIITIILGFIIFFL